MATVRTWTAPNLNGRLTGSDGAQQAAALIVQALENGVGLEPVTGQSFRVEASPDSLPAAWPTPAVNVSARWPGSGDLADDVQRDVDVAFAIDGDAVRGRHHEVGITQILGDDLYRDLQELVVGVTLGGRHE